MEQIPKENKEAEAKRRAWEEAGGRVDAFRDKKGKKIDQGIREALIGCAVCGVNTTASCEGHLDWGDAAPWIDVESPRHEELSARVREATNELEADAAIAELKQENLRERYKVLRLLDGFYSGREVSADRRLVIQALARGWSCIRSQGFDFQEIRDATERERKLLEYREEMNDFARFMRDEFFSGTDDAK